VAPLLGHRASTGSVSSGKTSVVSADDATFVLVHGGASSSAFWDLLVPRLSRRALAVDLPGRAGKPADPMTLTVDDCVSSVVADVEASGVRDCVLVAHSSGCYFVPGIAARLTPRVRHIVLTPPCVPPEGGIGLDAMKPSYARRNRENMASARRAGTVFVTPGPPRDPEVLRHAYGVELDDAQLAFLAAPQRNPRDSVNIYFQPVHWSAAAAIGVTVIRQLRDPITPLDLQDEMIARLPNPELVTVVDLDTGHVPAVTDVDEMAAILERLA
jgi:pimeloyl-ACP methyl ester carboxylesterase